MSEDLKKFASDLKSRRKKSKYSLQNIHQKTRIDIKFLEAIEEGDFDIIEAVYLRAFIKSYAGAIGLDPEETLKKFDLAGEGRLAVEEKKEIKEVSESTETEEKTSLSTEPEQNDESPWKNIQHQKYIVPAAIVILVIILLSVYFVFIKSEPKSIVKETPFNEVLAEKEAEPEELKKPDQERFEVVTEEEGSSEVQETTVGKIAVKLVATDTTWIRITGDDKTEEEYILFPGNIMNYNPEDNLKLLIGNSSGLNIFLNDSLLNFNSSKGEIKYVQVNEKGLTYLRVQNPDSDAEQN